MVNTADNPSSEPVTKADLSALKAEIIEAVQDTVKGLATQETVTAMMETVAETKEGVTELTGPKLAKITWLFVTFGGHQAMAQLIAKRVLISPLINKDFQFATLSSLVVVLLP